MPSRYVNMCLTNNPLFLSMAFFLSYLIVLFKDQKFSILMKSDLLLFPF